MSNNIETRINELTQIRTSIADRLLVALRTKEAAERDLTAVDTSIEVLRGLLKADETPPQG
jgi:hypothetical protein